MKVIEHTWYSIGLIFLGLCTIMAKILLKDEGVNILFPGQIITAIGILFVGTGLAMAKRRFYNVQEQLIDFKNKYRVATLVGRLLGFSAMIIVIILMIRAGSSSSNSSLLSPRIGVWTLPIIFLLAYFVGLWRNNIVKKYSI